MASLPQVLRSAAGGARLLVRWGVQPPLDGDWARRRVLRGVSPRNGRWHRKGVRLGFAGSGREAFFGVVGVECAGKMSAGVRSKEAAPLTFAPPGY